MKTEKFLEFNGKKITLVTQDGNFYIALKPIIEVLEVDWDNHKKWLNEHPIFNSVKVNITSTGSDGKSYKMVCIPEKFVYGWLLSFTPKTATHIAFQKECYDVLYSHFHNLLNNRSNELQQVNNLRLQHNELHKILLADPNYSKLIDLQQQIKSTNKNLIAMDNLLLSGQLELALK